MADPLPLVQKSFYDIDDRIRFLGQLADIRISIRLATTGASATTLSITTFSIMTLSILMSLLAALGINGTQHNSI
jgi:hypothetical protein